MINSQLPWTNSHSQQSTPKHPPAYKSSMDRNGNKVSRIWIKKRNPISPPKTPKKTRSSHPQPNQPRTAHPLSNRLWTTRKTTKKTRISQSPHHHFSMATTISTNWLRQILRPRHATPATKHPHHRSVSSRRGGVQTTT